MHCILGGALAGAYKFPYRHIVRPLCCCRNMARMHATTTIWTKRTVEKTAKAKNLKAKQLATNVIQFVIRNLSCVAFCT